LHLKNIINDLVVRSQRSSANK